MTTSACGTVAPLASVTVPLIPVVVCICPCAVNGIPSKQTNKAIETILSQICGLRISGHLMWSPPVYDMLLPPRFTTCSGLAPLVLTISSQMLTAISSPGPQLMGESSFHHPVCQHECFYHIHINFRWT